MIFKHLATPTLANHDYMDLALCKGKCWNRFRLGPLVPVKRNLNATTFKTIVCFQLSWEDPNIYVMVMCQHNFGLIL